MRTRYFAVTAFMLLLAAFVNAQPGGKKPVTTAGSKQASDFEYEVSITPLGLAGIIVRRKSALGLFTPNMLGSFAKNAPDPSFAIRPEKGAKMEDILAAIHALRVSPKADMRIEIDAGLNVFIPKKVDPNAGPPKPNPLMLVASVDETSNVVLNGEVKGSFPDTSKLEEQLKQIFDDRKKNGFAETTVMIKLARNMTFANFVELARAVHRGGSKSVGLMMDEVINVTEAELKKP